MHKREQMTTASAEGHSSDTDRRYIGTAELQSMNLEGVGGNPLLLAEQLYVTTLYGTSRRINLLDL